MQPEAIISTLLHATRLLKKPVVDIAGEAIRDAYEAAKSYLRDKFGPDSDGAKTLELATEKPESALRKALLVEETRTAGVARDVVLQQLIDVLAATLPALQPTAEQEVHVTGTLNRVNVAGRDIVTTERIVNRNSITPDARHLTAAQRSQLRPRISELAYRLAGRNARPRYAAVHAILQERFNVASYLLIPQECFPEAQRFLQKQCALHRQRAGQ
jgi:hypothetical protein